MKTKELDIGVKTEKSVSDKMKENFNGKSLTNLCLKIL